MQRQSRFRLQPELSASQGEIYGTVIESAPATPENVAEITTAPLASAVTVPVADTLATAVFDDDHVAEPVTSSETPPTSVATALNCVDDPTPGATPETTTVETLVAEVGELPHAATESPAARVNRRTTNDRIFMTAPCHGRGAGCRRRYTGVRPRMCDAVVAKV
jgi:hypothetical protein